MSDLRGHYFDPMACIICMTSVLDYFFNVWPQAITFSWEQKNIIRIIFLHISYELVYILCVVYVFESCTFSLMLIGMFCL